MDTVSDEASLFINNRGLLKDLSKIMSIGILPKFFRGGGDLLFCYPFS